MLQPEFGKRLKRLRTARGLSQSALGGEEISAGYMSRLESGNRSPTPRVTQILADRLGVPLVELVHENSPGLTTLLAEYQSAENSRPEESEQIGRILSGSVDVDPTVKWQALWTLVKSDSNPDLAHLADLVKVAEQLGAPTLLCRSEALYSRWLRVRGRYVEARDHARRGLAASAGGQVADRASALQSLIAAEADQGHLAEARQHADELLQVVEGERGPALTEALWANATVHVLEGDNLSLIHI